MPGRDWEAWLDVAASARLHCITDDLRRWPHEARLRLLHEHCAARRWGVYLRRSALPDPRRRYVLTIYGVYANLPMMWLGPTARGVIFHAYRAVVVAR